MELCKLIEKAKLTTEISDENNWKSLVT